MGDDSPASQRGKEREPEPDTASAGKAGAPANASSSSGKEEGSPPAGDGAEEDALVEEVPEGWVVASKACPGASTGGRLSLRNRFSVGPRQAARHVFAQKVTTPACYHQFVVYTLFSDDVPSRDKAFYMCASLLLVLLQILAVLAVASGVSAPSCVSTAEAPNDHCADGKYCKVQGTSGISATALRRRQRGANGFCSACLRNDGPSVVIVTEQSDCSHCGLRVQLSCLFLAE